jgi:hypothetical protein
MDGLGLSKYHNSVSPSLVNNSPHDNCASGSSTFHLKTAFDQASEVITGFDSNGFYIEFKITSFSEFWLHGSSSGTPLPVALTSFSANCTNEGSVRVNWTTASEQNSSHFVVSRSADGLSWTDVVTTEAAGTTNITQEYYFTDNEVGRNFEGYYRLLQVDLDGQSTMYNPIMVSCNGPSQTVFSVQPNPINGSAEFTASGFNQGNAQFCIQDVSGKLITERQLELNNGTMVFSVDLSACAPGMYIAKLIVQSGESKTVRILKD